MSRAMLYVMLDAAWLSESIYQQAGAVHDCALPRACEILMFVQNVGHHNAVDAIAGRMWLEGQASGDKISTRPATRPWKGSSRRRRWAPLFVSRSGQTPMPGSSG